MSCTDVSLAVSLNSKRYYNTYFLKIDVVNGMCGKSCAYPSTVLLNFEGLSGKAF